MNPNYSVLKTCKKDYIFMFEMKTYLQLALAAAVFVALSSAANIKEGPVGERPDGREEGGEDTLALVVVGKQHGGMINDANQYSNIR